MKQNSRSIVSEVAKPSGVGFDELNRAIESFGAGIADSVPAVVKQTRLMPSEHPDHFFDRLQTAAHRIVRPCDEETFGRARVVIAPEFLERFLDAPGAAGLEVLLIQYPKRHRLGAPPVSIGLLPRPFATRQRRVAHLNQATVFLLAHRIDRVTEVFGNVKPVMHDVSLGDARLDRTHESRPHIHSHCLDRGDLGRTECAEQRFSRFQFAFRHQIKHARAVDVGQDADVGVAFLGTLLVQPQMGDVVFSAPQHAALDRTHHDVVDGAPRKPRESAHALGGGTDLQQFDDKGFHQQGDAAVAFRPGHGQFFDSAVAVFELGDARFDQGLKLAGVQMPPLALSPTVDVSSPGSVRGIRPHLALLENNFNHHALIRQGKVNRFHRPGRLQSKKMFVKGGVFHDGIGVVEKQYSLTLRENSQYI